MSARQRSGPFDEVARKWLALALRRKQHIIDIYESGRWKRYYTEAQLIDEMRASIHLCDIWAEIAGVAPSGGALDRVRVGASAAFDG
jgi:uncharacterized repeat protein (TIGR03809 family)